MSYPSVLYMPEGEQYSIYTAAATSPNSRGGRWPLGTQLILQDGRKFRFTEVGGSDLVVGNALTGAVPASTDVGMTAAAGAVGDRLITFTHGAATVAANFFAEGFAVISVTPGGGDTYKISDHLALRNATAGDVVNLAAGHALRTALTTTSRVDLISHPYSKVVQSAATTVAAVPVGVAVTAAGTTKFCWIQTRGVVGVLTSGSAIAGDLVGSGLGTAGAVGPIAAIATQPIFGTVVRAAASGAWSSINLTIDG